MNPWKQIDTATLPNGDVMTLHRRADEFSLRVANVELMNSRQHGSEERLAELAVARLGAVSGVSGVSVLVGGLGMGFTLRAVLDLLPTDAKVTVAELVSQVVQWNRSHLGDLAAHPLADARTSVVVSDVAELLRASTAAFDIVLLDTDNGPEGTTQEENEWLYGPAGLGTIRSALKPGGVLAVWSVFPSESFTKCLGKAGFDAEVKYVRSRGKKGNRHVIWVAGSRKSGGAATARRTVK